MTGDDNSLPQPALPVEAKASLRQQLETAIGNAHGAVENALADLRQPGRSDPATTQALQAQLRQLQDLSRTVQGASPSALAALQADVLASVAASNSTVDQAVATSPGSSSAAASAAYARATADLDRKVAETTAADMAHDAAAHDAANRGGIDLSAFDRERTGLEQQKADAIARGDKVAERQADLLIAQNTQNAMAAGLDGITDPEERARYQREMADQQRIVAERQAALDQQIALDGARRAQELHLSPADAETYISQFKAERQEALQTAQQNMAAPDKAASDDQRTQMRALSDDTHGAAPVQVLPVVDPVSANDTATVKASFTTAQNSSTFNFDLSGLSPDIALSTAQHAHTEVVVPKTGLASGVGSPVRA